MPPPRARTPRVAPFTEKSFYLTEFRDRTLAIAAPARAIASWAPLEPVLKELEANRTDVLICCDDAKSLARLPGVRVLPVPDLRLEGVVWRALRGTPRVGLAVEGVASFPAASARSPCLRVSKLSGSTGRAGSSRSRARSTRPSTSTSSRRSSRRACRASCLSGLALVEIGARCATESAL
jgi:hypothetical protein